jgi:hypothetical protein
LSITKDKQFVYYATKDWFLKTTAQQAGKHPWLSKMNTDKEPDHDQEDLDFLSIAFSVEDNQGLSPVTFKESHYCQHDLIVEAFNNNQIEGWRFAPAAQILFLEQTIDQLNSFSDGINRWFYDDSNLKAIYADNQLTYIHGFVYLGLEEDYPRNKE